MSQTPTSRPPARPEGSEAAAALLRDASARVSESFVRDRTILSFAEYLAMVDREPRRFLRNSAMYLRDAFDHFGRYTVETPLGKRTRFRLFDRISESGDEALVGQEQAQMSIYRLLNNFVHQGAVERMILLHGPNGSAKTSLINGLVRGLEAYSHTTEGAVYSFNWVFPSRKVVRGSIGFGGGPSGGGAPATDVVGDAAEGSFAHLDGDALDARMPCEMRSDPLLLLPAEERHALFERWRKEGKLDGDFVIPRKFIGGGPPHKSSEIFDALLTSYGGDLQRVLAHIQVERFYYSRRYRRGVVTVEPQVSVDAGARQITADQSLSKLPPALSHVPLIEAAGDLVDANRGVIEFSDLLKRPLEAFKYLLGAVETQRVNIGPLIAYLDLVWVATTNEEYLRAFKEAQDFGSFKGRIELVRVPYLLRVGDEKRVYEQKVTRGKIGKPVAPHAIWCAALWATLTRMRRPQGAAVAGGDARLKELVDSLSPMEKVRLYESGEPPARLTSAQAQALRAILPEIAREAASRPIYEGIVGSSAREIMTVLLSAAQDPEFECLTPPAVLKQLAELAGDPSLHVFLRQEIVDGYHDNRGFLEQVREAWLDLVLAEVRSASGLVEEARYGELFDRYLRNVSVWLKGEKMQDPVTGEWRPADEQLLENVEDVIKRPGEKPRDFRQAMIARIASRSIADPSRQIEPEVLFPEHVQALKEDFYERNREQLARLIEHALAVLAEEREGEKASEHDLPAEQRRAANVFLDRMCDGFGYTRRCVTDALVSLLRERLS